MSRKSIVLAATLSLAAVFSSGCTSMMLSGAPTTRSFEEPPVRETVEAYPRESLFGKWTASGVQDQFVEGRRIMVLEVNDELELNEDGTCRYTETQTIVENKMGGGFGYRHTQEMQYLSEGTWSYENGILTMDLSMEVEGAGFIGKKTLNFTWVYTINWHSDEEFSTVATDEQFQANAQSSGNGLGWDSRTLEPNGVETFEKKGIPLLSPDTKVVAYMSPYKRAAADD